MLHNPSEATQLRDLLNALPIIATRVGYRTNSTAAEKRLADAAFKAHETWLEALGDAWPSAGLPS